MQRRSKVAVAFALVVGWGLAAGMSSCSSNSGAGLDQTCSINSDCNSPLVCAFGRCHAQCAKSLDCAAGERCVVSGTDGVCQLSQESTCGTGSLCQTGQVCGADQQCRTQCMTMGMTMGMTVGTTAGGCKAG